MVRLPGWNGDRYINPDAVDALLPEGQDGTVILMSSRAVIVSLNIEAVKDRLFGDRG